MSNNIRIFLGADLYLNVCEMMMIIQKQMESIISDQGANIRWIPPQNIHFTFKYIGDVERSLLGPILKVMRSVTEHRKPFRFTPLRIGGFPSGKNPRILYAKIVEGASQLQALQEDLEAALEELGIPRDPRPFKPYITIGRIQTPTKPINLTKVFTALGELPFGTSLLRDVSVIQTHLTPKGAQQQVLARSHLKGVLDQS